MLSYDNMIFFFFFLNTQPCPDRTRKNSRAMAVQLLELVDLVCQPVSVIIFHACHADQIYATCVLFVRRPRVKGARARPRACRSYVSTVT